MLDCITQKPTIEKREWMKTYDNQQRVTNYQKDKQRADALKVENAKKMRESWKDSDQINLNDRKISSLGTSKKRNTPSSKFFP